MHQQRTRTTGIVCSTVLLASFLSLVEACADRELSTAPVNPAGGAHGSGRGDVSAPVALGSGVVSPPGSTLPNDVIDPPQATITAIPESRWVVVTVNGQLTFNHNPDCDLISGFWQCEAKIPTLNFEAVPSTVGPLHLWVQEGERRSWVGLRGSGGAANSPGSAIGLVREPVGGTLMGEMTVFQAWAYNPSSGGSIPTFFVSGGYDVSATAVPSPIKLTESAADSEGTRAYTVEPLYGLAFMNPTGDSRPAGAITWYFFPGDDVSNTAGWAEYNEWIPDCQFQTTCRFRPPGPGKVQAYVNVERRSVAIRSSGGSSQCLAPGEPTGALGPRAEISSSGDCAGPKVLLTCTGDLGMGMVTRGQDLRCELTKESASAPGELRVQKWDFEGRQRTDGDRTSPSWVGAMATSGTVTVWAQIGKGAVQRRSVSITVQPRVWVDRLPALQIDKCPPSHTEACPLGSPLLHDLDVGMTVLFPSNDAIPEAFIDVGPNTGWSYIPGDGTPIRFRAFVTFLNSDLYDSNSNFYGSSRISLQRTRKGALDL